MKYLTYRLSAAMWARVLVLWLILAIGALVVGLMAFGLGRFVQDNIRTELASQQITFTANPTEDEQAIPGAIENAGQPVASGEQARIYSEFIALHMRHSAEEAGYPDTSYATLGGIQRQLRAEVAAATDAGDEAALAAAQEQLTAVTNLRNTMLTGSTLRGTLLSAYGWDNVATGMIAAGAAIVVLGLVFVLLFIYEWQKGHLQVSETVPAVERGRVPQTA